MTTIDESFKNLSEEIEKAKVSVNQFQRTISQSYNRLREIEADIEYWEQMKEFETKVDYVLKCNRIVSVENELYNNLIEEYISTEK